MYFLPGRRDTSCVWRRPLEMNWGARTKLDGPRQRAWHPPDHEMGIIRFSTRTEGTPILARLSGVGYPRDQPHDPN